MVGLVDRCAGGRDVGDHHSLGLAKTGRCRDGLDRISRDPNIGVAACATPAPPPGPNGGDRATVAAGRGGRTREASLWKAGERSLHPIVRSDCQWRLLPRDFSPFTILRRYLCAWRSCIRRGRSSRSIPVSAWNSRRWC
ncbi:transposase [Rhodovastum atsumiense]|uniref:Transposase n=1 Tax=Rhodovastum atsumiense TaxID=504468 RepID=A0A5M6IYW9_9PROT|nr:transposase [Rhodovastum atsumiense]